MKADMKTPILQGISPGEIWAVGGRDAAARTEWCRRIARDEAYVSTTALLSFAQHAHAAQRAGGWPAARYYDDAGQTVAEFLSYNEVYEINPFAVGERRPETRAAYRARQAVILRLLELRALVERPLPALSNGETRRVLLARALAKGPKILVLDDPAAGLDVRQREKLRDILSALAARGLAIVVAYRHFDELPPGVTKWLTVVKGGVMRETARPVPPPTPAVRRPSGASRRPEARHRVPPPAPPVVEIRDLTLAYGARKLFDGFSWTVRAGEHWILRGPNGSGKTTLFALITGDCPLAYAADVRVFGIPRAAGAELAKIRRRIGSVSPEMQACLGKGPDELVAAALRGKPRLLLLDEPFMNMEVAAARAAGRKIAAYLKANPTAAAILISHRADEVPACFDRAITLGDLGRLGRGLR